MGVLSDLKQLSAAEEFFDYLSVPFDPTVLRVARLHILKRMGEYLAADRASNGESEDAVRVRCRDHLEAAYADFVAHTPIEERVFKVHKDAVAPKAVPAPVLVPLTPLQRKD